MAENFPGAEEKVVEYFGSRESVRLAYLFGSAAEGREGPLSDIDIAVNLDESLDARAGFRMRLRLMSELAGILRTDRVDRVVMNDARRF
ncbi:MAG: nucleotidyltransferase domain-containing protein [Methanomicrobiales archaeon]|nr:nucleotidyltransferase domain-containing protein [Methanomicrobiales archaeon]MDI6876925.1 nucleotidyltransferase domain-containing protein [Methanomicrobiales archaeon]